MEIIGIDVNDIFFTYNALSFDISQLQCNITSDDLFNLFKNNNALYHHACQIKYSNTKLNRIRLKSEKLAEEAVVSSDEFVQSPL